MYCVLDRFHPSLSPHDDSDLSFCGRVLDEDESILFNIEDGIEGGNLCPECKLEAERPNPERDKKVRRARLNLRVLLKRASPLECIEVLERTTNKDNNFAQCALAILKEHIVNEQNQDED